jgi:hypothetical protein
VILDKMTELAQSLFSYNSAVSERRGDLLGNLVQIAVAASERAWVKSAAVDTGLLMPSQSRTSVNARGGRDEHRGHELGRTRQTSGNEYLVLLALAAVVSVTPRAQQAWSGTTPRIP